MPNARQMGSKYNHKGTWSRFSDGARIMQKIGQDSSLYDFVTLYMSEGVEPGHEQKSV